MKWLSVALLGVALAVMGCGTPSVHPIYSKDYPPVTEPGLVGTWKQSDADTTYTVTRAGEGYRLLARDKKEGAGEVKEWAFTVRLVKIGDRAYADFYAEQKEREALDEKWGPLFVPTHLFAQWTLVGDALAVRFIDRDWLEKAMASKSVTLASTRLNKDTILITAETAELQAFLKKYGGDTSAFADQVRLERVKP